MQQMHASRQEGMAGTYSQGFPIASLDASGHPYMRQWHQ